MELFLFYFPKQNFFDIFMYLSDIKLTVCVLFRINVRVWFSLIEVFEFGIDVRNVRILC